MVKVRCTHRESGKTWCSEPMRLPDAILWIAETDDVYCRLHFEIVSL